MQKLKKSLSLLLLIALISPLLIGCYDRLELEGIAFVVAVGIDKGPNDTLDLTARIAIPSEMSGGTTGGDSGKGSQSSKPITIRAHTFSEAVTLLNTTVERRVSLLHLTSILIGDSLSKDGLFAQLRPLLRNRELRRTVTISFTPGSARDVFLFNEPVMEKSASRWYEAVHEVGRYTGLGAPRNLHDFFVSIQSPLEDAFAPVIAVNKAVQKQSEQKSSGSAKQAELTIKQEEPSFIPGKTARIGGNMLEFLGGAVFKEGKLVTYIDGIQTRMMLMIRGELTRTQMDFSDPLEKGKYVALEIKHAREPIVQVDYSKRPVEVSLVQKLEGDLIGVQGASDYTVTKNLHILEQVISNKLKEKQLDLILEMFHEHQAEPFGIFKKTRSHFLTMQQMKEVDFRELLKDAKVSIKVDLKMRRLGVQLGPAQER